MEVNAGNLAWWSEQWLLEDAGSGYKRLKNRSNAQYMHNQNNLGYVQSGAIGDPNWWSAQWLFVDSKSLQAPSIINGVSQSKITKPIIFPNPSKDGNFNLTLDGLNSNEKVNVNIFDMKGKLVFKSVAFENRVLTLNTKLKPGFYLLKAFSQDRDFLCKVMVE